MGWGNSETDLTPALREGKLTIIPHDECNVQGSRDLRYLICLRYVNGSQPDNGDSGGPIVQLREKGNINSGYVQVGIGNYLTGYDLVLYADVAVYAGWIHRRISDCGNHPYNTMYHSNETPGPPTHTFPTKKTTTPKPLK